MVTREPEAKTSQLPSEQLPSMLPGVQEAVDRYPLPTCGMHVCVCLLHLKYPVSLQKGYEV